MDNFGLRVARRQAQQMMTPESQGKNTVEASSDTNGGVKQVVTDKDALFRKELESEDVEKRADVGGATWSTVFSSLDLVLEADFSNLDDLPDTLEIIVDLKDPSNEDGSLNLERGHLKPTGPGSWVAMGVRSLLRDEKEQNANRAGMDAVANLLLNQEDGKPSREGELAKHRFGEFFSDRYEAGQPLTVGALKKFFTIDWDQGEWERDVFLLDITNEDVERVHEHQEQLKEQVEIEAGVRAARAVQRQEDKEEQIRLLVARDETANKAGKVLENICNIDDEGTEIIVNRDNSLKEDGSLNLQPGYTKPTGFGSLIKMIFRAIFIRGKDERKAYQKGIETVRKLIFEKYGTITLSRFDKHFAHRYSEGKPLTVRALKVFINDEKRLREGVVNISNEKNVDIAAAVSLEELKKALSVLNMDEKRIIRGILREAIVENDELRQMDNYTLPIVTSFFSSSADRKATRDMNREGIAVVKQKVFKLLECKKGGLLSRQDEQLRQDAVEKVFDKIFAKKIAKGEALTVKELRSFVDAAIEIREIEDSYFWTFMTNAGTGIGYIVDALATGATVAAVASTLERDYVAGGAAAIGLAAVNPRARLVGAIGLLVHNILTPPPTQTLWGRFIALLAQYGIWAA